MHFYGKIFALFSLFLLFALSSTLSLSTTLWAADRLTLDTIFSCHQPKIEAEISYHVGIVLNDGPGMSAIIVAHHHPTGSIQLVAQLPVTSQPHQGTVIYEDPSHTFRLLLESVMGKILGDLSFIQDGPHSIQQKNLVCQYQGEITYELPEVTTMTTN